MERLKKDEAPIVYELWKWRLESGPQYTMLWHTADLTTRQRQAIAKRLTKKGWVQVGHGGNTHTLTKEALDYIASKQIPIGFGPFIEQLQGQESK